MGRDLTFADGQLGTTAAAVIAGASVPLGTRLDVILQNTSSVTQTVVLTFQRAGGTARRVARGVLAENEQMHVLGLPIQPDDTLLGVTTGASAVDYLVTASGSKALAVQTLDANGTPRQSLTNESAAETVDGRASTPVHDTEVRRAIEDLTDAIQNVLTQGALNNL
jgi:hypothetical protein